MPKQYERLTPKTVADTTSDAVKMQTVFYNEFTNHLQIVRQGTHLVQPHAAKLRRGIEGAAVHECCLRQASFEPLLNVG